MIELIVPAIIVIIITVFFVSFVFRNIVERLNQNAKKYFVDKLQDYEDVIDIKRQEIQYLNQQIKEIQEKKEKETSENPNLLTNFKMQIQDDNEEITRREKKVQEEVIFNIPTPQYREEEFFKSYHSLKNQFDVDEEKVIKEFLQKHTNKKEQKEYEILKQFRDYFDSDTIYQCLTLTKEEQFSVMESVTKKKQKQVLGLDEYEPEKFDLMQFLEKIDQRIKQIDPNIYVYVGQKEQNYDYLSEYIKTSLYRNMIEGIIISYQGKIYDYSI